jgi:V8-like Glu-specific endopeptidase
MKKLGGETCRMILCFLLTFGFSSSVGQAGRALPEGHLAAPVLIRAGNVEASGFFMRNDKFQFFITAKHVLFVNKPGDPSKKILINEAATLIARPVDPAENVRDIMNLNLRELYDDGDIKYSESSDVVIVRVAKVVKSGKRTDMTSVIPFDKIKSMQVPKSGVLHFPVEQTKKLNQVLIGNEVYLFGYPTSLGIKGFPQIESDKPLLRKGIIAGTNSKLKTIILDCPTYPGNSGGPVVEIEQIGVNEFQARLIGVVSEFVPYEIKWSNSRYNYTNSEIQNSGYSVITPIDIVLELMDSYK